MPTALSLWRIISSLTPVITALVGAGIGAEARKLYDYVRQTRANVNYDLYRMFDDVSSNINNIIDLVQTSIGQTIGTVKSSIDSTVSTVKQYLSRAYESTIEGIRAISSSIKSSVESIASLVRDSIIAVTSSLGQALAKVYSDVARFIATIGESISDSIRETYRHIAGVMTAVKEAIVAGLGHLESALVYAGDQITQGVFHVAQALNENFEKMKQYFGDAPFFTGLKEQINCLSELVREKLGILETSPTIRKFFECLPFIGPIVGTIFIALSMAFIITGFMQAAETGAIQLIQQQSLSKSRPTVPSENAITEGVRRGIIHPDTAQDWFARLGYENIGTYLYLKLYDKLLSQSEVARLWRMGLLDYNTAIQELTLLGYDEDRAKAILATTEQTISPSDAVMLFWRGEISEDRLNEELFKYGFSGERIELIKKAALNWPTPSDLIRFAVREVFTPEVVEKFGLFEDLPEEFLAKAKEVGLPENWAKAYWAAHWELPSYTEGIEMLRRLSPEFVDKYPEKFKAMGLDPEKVKTDLETLKLLLRTQDVMPFWRDKLVAISYEPLTRVDLRRIYELGLIDDDRLYWALREHGYDHDNATIMLEFYRKLKEESKKEEKAAERDLSKSEIIEIYKEGKIDRNTAKNMLVQLGYDENEAEYIVAIADYKIAKEEQKYEIDLIKQKYLDGELNNEQVFDELSRLGLKPKDLEYHYYKITRPIKEEIKWPSRTDLDKFLQYKLITPEEYVDILVKQGYSRRFAEMYLKLPKGGRT